MGKRVHGERLPMLAPRIVEVRVQRVMVGDAAVHRESSRPWKRRRDRQLQREPLCRMCKAEGRVVAAEEVDHDVPLIMGGSIEDSNLQSLCRDHHAAKTADENAVLNGRVVAVY